MIFNLTQNNQDHSENIGYIQVQNNVIDEQVKELLDQRDRLKDDKIRLLEEQVAYLKERIRGMEGR